MFLKAAEVLAELGALGRAAAAMFVAWEAEGGSVWWGEAAGRCAAAPPWLSPAQLPSPATAPSPAAVRKSAAARKEAAKGKYLFSFSQLRLCGAEGRPAPPQ